MGPKKTLGFFARPEKFRGTACFLLGVGLILLKYPLIGFVIECYGILNLFGDFFGVVVGFLGSIPVVSLITDTPNCALRGAPLTGMCYRWDPIWKGRCGGLLVSSGVRSPLISAEDGRLGVDNIARRYTAVARMKQTLGLFFFPVLALMGDSRNFSGNCSQPWGHDMYYGSGEYTYTTHLYHRKGVVWVGWFMCEDINILTGLAMGNDGIYSRNRVVNASHSQKHRATWFSLLAFAT